MSLEGLPIFFKKFPVIHFLVFLGVCVLLSLVLFAAYRWRINKKLQPRSRKAIGLYVLVLVLVICADLYFIWRDELYLHWDRKTMVQEWTRDLGEMEYALKYFQSQDKIEGSDILVLFSTNLLEMKEGDITRERFKQLVEDQQDLRKNFMQIRQ